jgi:putative transposase
MKRKRYSEEQTAFALRQAESGTVMEEICRKMGISDAAQGWARSLVEGKQHQQIGSHRQMAPAFLGCSRKNQTVWHLARPDAG